MLGKAEYMSYMQVQHLLSTPPNTSQCSVRAAIFESFLSVQNSHIGEGVGGALSSPHPVPIACQSKPGTVQVPQTEHLCLHLCGLGFLFSMKLAHSTNSSRSERFNNTVHKKKTALDAQGNLLSFEDYMEVSQTC